jgi:uncharacterized protein YdeI (YjbR/CyaY-like superfamily)
MNDAPEFYAKDRKAWRQWLLENHQNERAVWLVYDKGEHRKMSWQDIVQEALCFGWIDSRPGKVSEKQSKIYISKRKPKSVWSKINKDSIALLQEQGLMTEAGLEAVAVAKKNGSWSTLEKSDNLIVPPELEAKFESLPNARAHFNNFPVSAKRNALQWIYDAKTPTTRNKRVTEIAEAAEENKRLR